MARKKTDVEIEIVKHPKTGDSFKLLYDREKEEFWAVVAGQKYTGPDIKVVKENALAALEEAQELTWYAIIEVKPLRGYQRRDYEAQVGLEISRYYVTYLKKKKVWPLLDWKKVHNRYDTHNRGYDPDAKPSLEDLASVERGTYGQATWDPDNSRRNGDDPPEPPLTFPLCKYDSFDYNRSKGPIVFCFQYTPELWAAFEALLERIKLLDAQLRDMLGSDELVDAMTRIGSQQLLALPAGERKE